jgi:hypothetical protein
LILINKSASKFGLSPVLNCVGCPSRSSILSKVILSVVGSV